MEAIVKGIKGEMAETKEFVLIHNVEELKAVGLTVPQTTQLLWELRQEGISVPLDALSDEECAAALWSVLS